MHKVKPNIKPVSELTHFSLASITIFTLWNQGTTNVLYGFGDIKITLKPGQTVTFEAGANTVFASDSQLTIDFVKVGGDDINACVIQFNRLTQVSKMFADIAEK